MKQFLLNCGTKIDYWHLAVVLIAAKYLVFSAIHLHQYLYISGQTVPADLSKHLTQALWDRNRAELIADLNGVIWPTFLSSSLYLVFIGMNMLTLSWTWINRSFLKRLKFDVTKSFIFYIFFRSFLVLITDKEDRNGTYILFKTIIDAITFGACLQFSSNKRRMWTVFWLLMTAYISYDAIYVFFYWPAYKTSLTLIKILPILHRIKEIAGEVGFPVDRIFIDAFSRFGRDTVVTTGLGRFGVIIFGDQALMKLRVAGTIAVATHELGHWYYYHGLYTFILRSVYTVARSAASLYLISDPRLYQAFFIPTDTASTLPFGVGLFIVDILADELSELCMPLFNMYSWFKEYQADEFSCRFGQARALYDGLIRLLSKESEAVCTLPYGLMYSSHPIFSRRMDNLAKLF